MIKIERNSSFELLRLIAQFMIVVYHILLFWFVHTDTNPIHVYKAICIPLHIGVILYVLISGYYGIRFSLRGVVKLVANLLLYGLAFSIIGHFWLGDALSINEFFFISNSPFWFVKTYLMLYLAAPFVNRLTQCISANNRFLLILILLWASCYVGLMGFDSSLTNGTNLIHFILLYLIGNTLALYMERINRIPLTRIILSYVFINVFSIGIYLLCVGSKLEGISYALVFKYNSIILILNAVCLFVVFMRMNFKNKIVNYLASSCLAVYLIHSTSLVLYHPIKYAALYIQTLTDNIALIVLFICVLAIIVTLGSIMIDKFLLPYWKCVKLISDHIDKTKLGIIAQEWAQQ